MGKEKRNMPMLHNLYWQNLQYVIENFLNYNNLNNIINISQSIKKHRFTLTFFNLQILIRSFTSLFHPPYFCLKFNLAYYIIKTLSKKTVTKLSLFLVSQDISIKQYFFLNCHLIITRCISIFSFICCLFATHYFNNLFP